MVNRKPPAFPHPDAGGFLLSYARDSRNAVLGAADIAAVVTQAVLAHVAADALDVGAGGRWHSEAVAHCHWAKRIGRGSAECVRT